MRIINIRVTKCNLHTTIYNTRFYELEKINETDSYRLFVKYKGEKSEERKLLDILNSSEFQYINY